MNGGSLDWNGLPALFPGFEAPGRWLPLLQRHGALLVAASERVRVTAVPPWESVRRQYAESLEVLRIAELSGPVETCADVGSGGGFPGLVMAAVRPGMRVHLVEPFKRRAAFLEEVARELGLRNVTVHAVRAEEAGRGPLRDATALVTARAVAEMRELLEYTAPLTAPGGFMALPKGSSLPEELAAARPAMDALKCELAAIHRMRAEVSELLAVAVIRKMGHTPVRYPRRPGMPGKRPL